MGRTNPTFRDALRVISDRWEEYKRGLRRRDKRRFDQLFAYAQEHADAGGLLNHENPILPALFSVDLEQERRLDDHEDRLKALEAAIETGETEPEAGVTTPADEGQDGTRPDGSAGG
jgi:hypothetical protein